MSACLGGIKDDGGFLADPASSASYNARTGYAPFASTSSLAELAQFVSQIPDIDDSGNFLRWAILFGQSNGVGFTNVRGQVQISSNTISTAAAPTALTGASHLALLTSTGLGFARDADPNDCRLRVFGSSVSGSFDELDYCILAVAMWIEEL
jgi:hypothetical protein